MNEEELDKLLELAAKAHGFQDREPNEATENGLYRNSKGRFYIVSDYGWSWWAPHEYDSEAFGLAIAAKIDILPNINSAQISIAGETISWEYLPNKSRYDTKPMRIAILRVAAKLADRYSKHE